MPGKSVFDLFRLDGRRALVTGGAKGLGKVIATALAQAGADVAIASRTLEECRATAAEITAATGRKTAAFRADAASAEAVEKLASEARAALGPIDILVNNAGINIRGAAHELSVADWDAVLDVNLKAPFLC